MSECSWAGGSGRVEKDGPLPSPAVLWIVSVRERKPWLKKKKKKNIEKFLRTLILKNVCDRLLVKINISVTNSEAVAQRSSVKRSVPRNFAKFTVEHLCQCLLFNKDAGLRLWRRCFPVNFVKFLRPPFSPLVAASANLPKGGNSWILLSF